MNNANDPGRLAKRVLNVAPELTGRQLQRVLATLPPDLSPAAPVHVFRRTVKTVLQQLSYLPQQVQDNNIPAGPRQNRLARNTILARHGAGPPAQPPPSYGNDVDEEHPESDEWIMSRGLDDQSVKADLQIPISDLTPAPFPRTDTDSPSTDVHVEVDGQQSESADDSTADTTLGTHLLTQQRGDTMKSMAVTSGAVIALAASNIGIKDVNTDNRMLK